MVLKEWAEAWNLYNACRARCLIKAIYAPTKAFPYWYLWGSTVFYGLSAWLFTYGRGAVALVGLCLTLLAFWAFFVAVERALAKEFEVEYENHGIAAYPLSMRRLYLRYALFLRGLADQARSRDDVARLGRFAEVAGIPAPAFRISQHPVIVPLVTVLIVLSTELIKQSETWKGGKGALFIFILGSGLFFLALVLDGVRSSKHKHQEIQRFLQWAEFDIEEKPSNQGVQPTAGSGRSCLAPAAGSG